MTLIKSFDCYGLPAAQPAEEPKWKVSPPRTDSALSKWSFVENKKRNNVNPKLLKNIALWASRTLFGFKEPDLKANDLSILTSLSVSLHREGLWRKQIDRPD